VEESWEFLKKQSVALGIHIWSANHCCQV